MPSLGKLRYTPKNKSFEVAGSLVSVEYLKDDYGNIHQECWILSNIDVDELHSSVEQAMSAEATLKDLGISVDPSSIWHKSDNLAHDFRYAGRCRANSPKHAVWLIHNKGE